MDPAVVIVHGAWHTPHHYQDLVKELHRAGFSDVVCPRLPSAFDKLPLPTDANLVNDTIKFHGTIRGLVDAGRPVVLVMHSYGGVVGNNSVNGLLWPQRQQQRKSGGVVHLIYTAAFVAPANTSLTDPFGGKMQPWIDEDVENGTMHMQNPRQAFYAHLSDSESQYWLEKTVFCPACVVREKQTYAPYEFIGNGVDATYLVCTKDKELTTQVQEGMASLLGDARVLRYCDAGHCCMLGYAEKIAGVVKEAWERSLKRLDST